MRLPHDLDSIDQRFNHEVRISKICTVECIPQLLVAFHCYSLGRNTRFSDKFSSIFAREDNERYRLYVAFVGEDSCYLAIIVAYIEGIIAKGSEHLFAFFQLYRPMNTT